MGKKILAVGKVGPSYGYFRTHVLEWLEDDDTTSLDIDRLLPGEKKKLESRFLPNAQTEREDG
jgi:hypothetical protein